MELTGIERCGGVWLKRDDLYVSCEGACGGKARVVEHIIRSAVEQDGIRQFSTCGSRTSRQCRIVARICEKYGVESHLFMPSGPSTDITDAVEGTKGATLHRTKVGYNNVLDHAARQWAEELLYRRRYIAFGLEEEVTISVQMHQVRNIPPTVRRIVIPVGSGMQMVSVIHGLQHYGMTDVKVMGVVVGKDPRRTFRRFIGDGLFGRCDIEYSLTDAAVPYGRTAPVCDIGGIMVDGMYEAKCLPFLEDGDLFWIVGK